MNKILLILQREYLVRIKKKSFIIMTFLGPVLIAAFYGAIGLITYNQLNSNEETIVFVEDASGMLEGKLLNQDNTLFQYHKSTSDYDAIKKEKWNEQHSDGQILLYIPPTFSLYNNKGIKLSSEKEIGRNVQNDIEEALEESIKKIRLKESGISENKLDSLEVNIDLEGEIITADGGSEISSKDLKTGIGMVCAFIIYMFIFLYGSMVMRGVLEEKTNRIVEVIITSVKPFQLMMGKIIGIALVGLTQLFVWAILGTGLIFVVSLLIGAPPQTEVLGAAQNVPTQSNMEMMMMQINNVNWYFIIGCFMFYFIGGYLMYSAMFAAIAGAVDSETDTQQFMFPISLPLIFGIVIAQTAIANDPHNTLATVFSMIPFTSPVVMMARLPFDVPVYQLILSMVFLILGFIFTVYIGAKIYRTGILLYGKKVTYKELFKWLFYK